MRFIVYGLSLQIAALMSTFGQSVTVEVFTDQDYFLPHESLPVKVRVTNYSGQTLHLGQEEDWLTFNIEGHDKRFVSRLGTIPVTGKYSLDSSKTGTKSVDLAPYFDLAKPGRYQVTASVKIPNWQRVLQSKPKTFDVITGSKIWEQEFGVPKGAEPGDTPPEARKYALVQTLHQKDLRLYFRLSDTREIRVSRIYPLGTMASFSRPEPQLDRFSNLHVLYQSGARSFTYSLINPEGLLIARETHEIAATRPMLRADEEGRINVVGGVRRFTRNDVPPPPASSLPTDVESTNR